MASLPIPVDANTIVLVLLNVGAGFRTRSTSRAARASAQAPEQWDGIVLVWTLIAKTRNPTRARTPINRKRLVNKAEATAAAIGNYSNASVLHYHEVRPTIDDIYQRACTFQ